MKWVLAGCVLAGAAAAQVTPYGLKVETGPGLVVITFSTAQNQARAYFPDDVAPGEGFSGALEGQPNYVLEFAGQRARVRDGVFHWTMPGVAVRRAGRRIRPTNTARLPGTGVGTGIHPNCREAAPVPWLSLSEIRAGGKSSARARTF